MSNVWKQNEELNKSYDPNDMYNMTNLREVAKPLSSTSNLS